MSNDKHRPDVFNEASFWDKMASFAKRAGQEIVEQALVLYYIMRSAETPMSAKLTIAGALGYLILPVDFIPDWIPGLGLTDDAAVLLAAYNAVSDHITDEVKKQATDKLAEWFS